jgi:DNA repair exonuclease SbcCD ATPase subunit
MVDRYSLVSISVSNFKSFEDVEVIFTSEGGITRRSMTIFGKLGSGKSTLIDAIQWCAYGTSSSDSSKLARINIFPSDWNGEQKNDLSVLLRLRPEGADDSRDHDIQCQRLLSTNNASDILQVTVGHNTQTPQESREKFEQIFGIKPKLREGVMWILREEEMQRMAQTIARDDSSYFLDFMNLRVPLNGLKEMNRTVQNRITKISKDGNLTSDRDRLNAISELNRAKGKLARKKEAIESILTRIHEEKPDKEQERLAVSGEEMTTAVSNLQDARTELQKQKIVPDEIQSLLHSLLASKIINSGLKIEKSRDGSKFEWDEIADFLEGLDLYEDRIIRDIRGLSDLTGIDTSKLLEGESKIEEWKNRIIDLKKAKKDYLSAEIVIEDFESDGITIDSIKTAKSMSDNYKRLVAEYNRLREEKNQFKKEVEDAQQTLDNVETELEDNRDIDDEIKELTARGKIIRALAESIKTTDSEYKKKMFEQTIGRVEYFWHEIYAQNRFKPILIEDAPSRFALEKISNGAIHEIDSKFGGGSASNGETELLLVCTCLAIAESSGAKMPVILDDCFTKIDPDTRRNLVNVVTREFGSLIFVTNDQNKAKLHTSADGVIELNFEDTWDSINHENLNDWAKWRDSFD